MKKKVLVTVLHELEIDIPDHLTAAENLKKCSSFMGEVKEPEELFKHAAYCAIKGYGFAEGLGEIIEENSGKIGVRVKMAHPRHDYKFSNIQ